MSLPFRRRTGWPSPHERARAAAAERLTGPIDREEAAWLDAHLEQCADCRAVAGDYEAQRLELLVLRDRMPEPPRDLWARTAAAIERESARAGVGRDTPANRPAPRRARPAAAPLGALSALLVVVVVVGATLLSQRQIPVPGQTGNPTQVALASSRPTIPGATPFSVAAGNVGWLVLGGDNQIDVFDSEVNRVCPERQGAECPPIEEPSPKSLRLPDTPSSVVKAPNDDDIVVDTGKGIYVVPAQPATASASPAPTPSPSAAITASPSPSPTKRPVQTPTPSAPSVTATPTASAAPTPTPADTPTPTVAPTPSSTALATPSASPTPVVTASATPAVTISPSSSSPGTVQIASDVVVVGEAAAYSADGEWFAFSARPADGSHGPDIYAWHVGDAKARPITTDHASVFASWRGARILASRAIAGPTARTRIPESFLLDPVGGNETRLAVPAVWRPSVHPAGRLAVYWDGTVSAGGAGADLEPGNGRLVVGPWRDDAAAAASPTPDASGKTGPDASSTAPLPSPAGGSGLVTTQLAGNRISNWDARWDETGTRLAVWIADGPDPKIGKLTLYSVDAETGVVRAEKALRDVRALAGFSIGKGRLVWATPRGQDAKGSRVQVVAWSRDAVGSAESRGSNGEVVVIR